MKRSQNEIAAMFLKAARGAGYSIGLAEDFSAAMVHLASEDTDANKNAMTAL